MDLEGKVDEMRGMLHEMKPVIAASAETLKSLDDRQRALEIGHAEHKVQIVRIQSDLDGLGRKVRSQPARVQPASHDGSKWIAFLEVVAVLPKYWQALIVLGSLAMTMLALGLRAYGIHVP